MIAVPFHLGRRDIEVGRGPLRIVALLGAECQMVERSNSSTSELGAVSDVNAQLAQAVRSHAGAPLVLVGNCNSCVGTLAGLHGRNIGIVWLDAHGDFNTPETTISGALEGMSLAIATGSCHDELRRRIGLAEPVPEANVLLVATRSIDPVEETRLQRSSIRRLDLDELRSAVEDLATRVSAIYLHLDLDVLNPELSPGVNFSEPGGIRPEDLYAAIQTVAGAVPIAAAAIANFNPDRDREDRTLKIAARLAGILSDVSVV